MTEPWHCHQLPGARVVCEREDLLKRIDEADTEIWHLQAELACVVGLALQDCDDPARMVRLIRQSASLALADSKARDATPYRAATA